MTPAIWASPKPDTPWSWTCQRIPIIRKLKLHEQIYLHAGIRSYSQKIEQIIQNSLDREVATTHIGELVMERLKPLDEVAYVRFASVYRQFKDVSTFVDEVTKLLNEK